MTTNEFNEVLDMQLMYCKSLLVDKAKEYDLDSDDRLHSFKTAAAVLGTTQKQALCGMMCKHTISIYDMCFSPDSFSKEKWLEKITDHINYLLLLRGIIEEESKEHERYSN